MPHRPLADATTTDPFRYHVRTRMSLDLDDRHPPLPWPARLVFVIALALTALGLYCIYTTENQDGKPLTQSKSQTAFIVLGLVACAATATVGHARIGQFAYPLFGVTLALLVLLVIARKVNLAPIIPLKRNTARWVEFGPVRIQPSELAKVVYILALANYLKFRSSYRTLKGLLGPFALTIIPMGLILVEPDLGTSLLLLPTLFIMLFAAGARRRHLATLLALGLLAAPAFYVSGLMSPYQKERVEGLVRQNDDDPRWQKGPGFQLRQSKIAIGAGGWTGQTGDDAAFFRHDLLPEEHNDFIFAVIGHQYGFAGATLAVLAYMLLIFCGLMIASATDDPFARLLAVGVCAIIGAQTFINIGMTIGLMPITGMTLPFVSSGGSSLVTNYIAIGLLLSVSRRRPILIARKPFEFGARDDHHVSD